MTQHPTGNPKWTLPESSLLSTMVRERVHATIERNLQAMGPDVRWSDIVNSRTMDLFSLDDASAVDESVVGEFMLIEGRKLLAGSEVAVSEMPDRYMLRSDWEAAQAERTNLDDLPEGALGWGDNVFGSEDIEGEVIIIRQVSEVYRMMTDGVPEGAIGVIDDAGGTMTAPILPEFTAVICRAGTVRSHLAIIAREYGVPTLMGTALRQDLHDGDRIRVEYSTKATNADAYHGGEASPRALIWEV